MSHGDAPTLANQPGARDSDSPKTEPGKLVARMNSLTRDLRGEHGLVPSRLADAVAKHSRALIEFYHPATDHQAWLLEQVADAAARLDYCQFMLRAQINDMADRADLCWDEDRRRAVEEIASRLHKDPSRTAARLRQTPQGCRWILARWNALSVPLAENTPWDETRCNLAASLMGVGPDLRASCPGLNHSASPDEHAAVMRKHVDMIKSLMTEALEPLDAKERELTSLGYPLRPSKEYLRIQRQESRLRKVYNDAMHAFRQARAEGFAATEPVICLPPGPKPTPVPLTPDNHLPPELESEPESEHESDSPFEGKPVMAMLAALVESVNGSTSPRPSPVSLSSALPQTIAPLNRKARRAREKAARKLRTIAG